MDTSFQKTKASDEWYTPIKIIDALGKFDIDPCAAEHPLWVTADIMWNKNDVGLSKDWMGRRVWCNPPYSQPLLTCFVKKMIENGNGILLTFVRVDNRLFQDMILPYCDAILFLRHRIRFYKPDGSRGDSPGCGSCLIGFGENNVKALESSGLTGFLMKRNHEWKNI